MIKWLTAIFAGCSAILIAGYFYLMQLINQPLPIEEKTLLTVESGTSVNSLSAQMQQMGWHHQPIALKLLLKLQPKLAKIKSGTFEVTPGLSLQSLFILLSQGKEHQFHITFIEGSTFKDWLLLIAQNPHIKKTMSGLTISEIAAQLGIKAENPEGLFFPDTYAFTLNTTDKEILSRAHRQLNQHLEQIWQNRADDLPYNTAYEALIMASIIEKETSVLAEQGKVSSVFVNRLRKNMRLQTDPTIIYGLGERYTGDITFANIREKTAYNTYRINGLPPTPIAMPGLAALTAAVNPEQTNYFYFVANDSGQHQFSETLQEHNKAVEKYQLGKKRD